MNNVVPAPFDDLVASLVVDRLGGQDPVLTWRRHGPRVLHVTMGFRLPRETPQDDWRLTLTPSFEPTFRWMPHLTPTSDHVAAWHCFRAPALIVEDATRRLAVVPDLDTVGTSTSVPWYLDLDAAGNTLVVGLGHYEPEGHVLYRRASGAVHAAGVVEVGLYLLTGDPCDGNPFEAVSNLQWQLWGRPRLATQEATSPPLDAYVEHAHRWAHDTWGARVWNEFTVSGVPVGAPSYMANVTHSPNHPGPARDFLGRAVFNQAWWSSVRTAAGLRRHARRVGRDDLLRRANLTKELALAAPLDDGLFDTVLAVPGDPAEALTAQGRHWPMTSPRPWAEAVWTNGWASPWTTSSVLTGGVDVGPRHVVDMSWTCLNLLEWHRDLDPDPRILRRVTAYAERLVELQDRQGYFPGWLDRQTSEPMGVLDQGPESAASAWFLLALSDLTGERRFAAAAHRAIDVICSEVVPVGRWEDFETYFSCSTWGQEHIGRPVARNAIFKQCNLGPFWTAGALLAAGSDELLAIGRRCLDELLMTQAVWQPPWLPIPVFGGFGVLNGDAEWNDARQSLFAPLIVAYGQRLGSPDHVDRGLAAARAGFSLMYCPQNQDLMSLFERAFPFFGVEDFGFCPENFGHSGLASPAHEQLPMFCEFDWGAGSAAATVERLRDEHPDLASRLAGAGNGGQP